MMSSLLILHVLCLTLPHTHRLPRAVTCYTQTLLQDGQAPPMLCDVAKVESGPLCPVAGRREYWQREAHLTGERNE
jgi:hypothetical protein